MVLNIEAKSFNIREKIGLFDFLAISICKILNGRGGRIACANEHKYTFALPSSHISKGLNTISPCIAIDGYSIGSEGIQETSL